ncbi:hypothetical protein EJB05_27167, partial [Eragrostis curvula]
RFEKKKKTIPTRRITVQSDREKGKATRIRGAPHRQSAAPGRSPAAAFRRCGVVERQRPHGVVPRRGVPEPVRAEHLVVGEVERGAHPAAAALRGVGRVPLAAAGRAPDEVRDERPPPPVVAAAVGARDAAGLPPHRRVPRRRVPQVLPLRVPPPQRLVPFLDGLVPRRDAGEPAVHVHVLPVPLQVVLRLDAHRVPEPAALPPVEQQVRERRLVARVVAVLLRELLPQLLPPTRVLLRVRGAHPGPLVEEVERPLAVADEDHAGVDPQPRPPPEEPVGDAVHDEVAAGVPRPEREGEVHVGEHGVGVHPPQPLRLRVGHHGGAQDGQLRPRPRHRRLQGVAVVDELDPVEPAVVELRSWRWSPSAPAHGSGCDPDTITTVSPPPPPEPEAERSHAARFASQPVTRRPVTTEYERSGSS